MAERDVLCSDKTGTLTLNQLSVDKNMIDTFAKGADKDMVVLKTTRASRLENQDAIDCAIVSMLADPKEAQNGIKEVHFLPFNPHVPTGSQPNGVNVAELIVGRVEPYSDEAIALMKRKIVQRVVKMEVETIDRTGTLLGSLWKPRSNGTRVLLEVCLAKLQTSSGSDRIPEFYKLEKTEQSAKSKKLESWENFVEGKEVPNGANVESNVESKQQVVLKVVVT